MTGQTAFDSSHAEGSLGWETKDRQPGNTLLLTGPAVSWLCDDKRPGPHALPSHRLSAPGGTDGGRRANSPLIATLLGGWSVIVLTLYFFMDPVVLLLLMGGLAAALLSPLERAQRTAPEPRQAPADAPAATTRRSTVPSAAMSRRRLAPLWEGEPVLQAAGLVSFGIHCWRSVDVLVPVRPAQAACQPAPGEQARTVPAEQAGCFTAAKSSPMPADLKPFLNPVEIYLA